MKKVYLTRFRRLQDSIHESFQSLFEYLNANALLKSIKKNNSVNQFSSQLLKVSGAQCGT
jgi:hypothetical protein